MTTQPIVLDVSDLPAPEPFDRIMEALRGLAKNQYMRVEHRQQPMLLYPQLQQRGFRYHVQQGSVQAFDIFIWHGDRSSPEGLVEPNLAEGDNPPGACR